MDDESIFGDLKHDMKRQRLLRVGVGIGLILGAALSWDFVRYIVAFLGLLIVVVSWIAQIVWPDLTPAEYEASQGIFNND